MWREKETMNQKRSLEITRKETDKNKTYTSFGGRMEEKQNLITI